MVPTKHDNDNIVTKHIEKATQTLLESHYGIHALVVYSDMITLREFCSSYAKKSIQEKDELLFLAPFYQTADSLRETLSQGHKSIDVNRYEKEEKSLIIVDSLENYYDKATDTFDTQSILKANQKLVDYAKSLKKKGLSFLGDSGAFLFKNQLQSLVDYESSLPIEFDTNLKGICLYHQKDFDRLSMDQKEEIIKHHKLTIKI
ncbi:MAG TPA: MEDS domain-containing protein [Candidatus Nitrosocosmicus sp.]|nr:MEDS domain-containing protein [Candidatus Nitrosocosmicus sp.]